MRFIRGQKNNNQKSTEKNIIREIFGATKHAMNNHIDVLHMKE